MVSERLFDVVVVGAGPGGYPGAFRAAELGLSVAVIEEGLVGGECTNYGCVPTKALLRAARLAADLARYEWAEGRVDPGKVMEWARSVASEVRRGLEGLFERRGIEIVRGRAVAVDSDKCVRLDSGDRICARRGVILATGSDPLVPPGVVIDERRVITNRGFMRLEQVPESLVVVGGGFVGVELAYAAAALGSRVTLLEALNRILPMMDKDASAEAAKTLRRLGVEVLSRHRVESARPKDGGAVVTASGPRGERVLEASAVLVAIGRRPRLPQLPPGVGRDERGYVRVECGHDTGIPWLHAAGDVTGPPLLAHKAIVQSLAAAESIAGERTCLDGLVVPEVVYIEPEIVRARSPRMPRGRLLEARIRVEAMARSRVEGIGGYAKVVWEEGTGRIWEISMAFPGASEAAGEAAGLVARGARLAEAAAVVRPHPTLSEALSELFHSALGAPVHVLSARVRPWRG